MRWNRPMVEAVCLCGAVRITTPFAPSEVKACNCGACRRLGTLWAYYNPAQVKISGTTVGFQRHDMGEPAMLAFHHCPICGCTTHWADLDRSRDRMGVNARLMTPQVMSGAKVAAFDGAETWTVMDDPPTLARFLK